MTLIERIAAIIREKVSVFDSEICGAGIEHESVDDAAKAIAEVTHGGLGDDTPLPYAFVQWKGTNVCMDFQCECGANCHFDGFFAYTVECPHCHLVYRMPSNVFPKKMTADEVADQRKRMAPVMLERDEEIDDAN